MRSSTVSLFALMAGLAAAPALAQDAEPGTGPETAAEAGATVLDEIVVTTRRTEELLEDVPGSVVVLGDEEIERSNLEDTDDLIRRLPNVNFTEGSDPTDVDISIRGLANLVGDSASGPTNGVFVDGVLLNPTGSVLGVNPNLFDLERVEVAFGPQGTAFGRGTIGGAINFVPKKPTDAFEAEISTEIGSFPDGEFRTVLNAPILPDGLLSARFVGFGSVSNGFIDLTTVDDAIDQNDIGGRLSLRSQPTDRLTLDFSASFDRSRFNAPRTATLDSVEAGDPTSDIDVVDDDDLDRALITGDVAYDFDFGTLSSKTSFLNVTLDSLDDSDFTALDIISTEIESLDQSVAQEFRFESAAVDLGRTLGTVSVNGGAAFSFNTNNDAFVVDSGPDFFPAVTVFATGLGLIPPGSAIIDDGSFGTLSTEQDVFNLGIFGELRWAPTDRLELAAGARFNRDVVTVNTVGDGEGLLATSEGLLATEIPGVGPAVVPFLSPLPPVFPPTPFAEEEEVFTAVTPNASIRYDWTENLSTYLSFSTGFRAGGFSATPGGLEPFDEESVIGVEGGFRTTFLDNRLALRGAGFYLDYTDIQVVSTTDVVGITVIDNAASAQSIGSEIGVSALPAPGFRVDLDWGLTFAEFTDFTDSPFGDLTGETLPNAPTHTVSLVGDYQRPLGILDGALGPVDGFIRSEYTFTSDFANIVDPGAVTFGPFDNWNLRVGLRAERFVLEAFVENTINDPAATGSVSGVADFLLGDIPTLVDVGQPTRRFGFRASMQF